MTITYYVTFTDTTQSHLPATSPYPPVHVKEAQATAGSTVDTINSGIIAASTSAVPYAAYTAANLPGEASWPSGTYGHVTDCSQLGVDILYSVAHFYRVNSARSTTVASVVDTNPSQSTTGLKTWEMSWSPGGSTASDVYGVTVTASRAVNHGNQSIDFDIDESDDTLYGPWVAAGPAAGLRTLALTGAGI